MLRHIAWFNETPIEPSKEGLTSPDAVTCSRCLVPARALEKLGVECSVFGNLEDADPAQVGKHLQKLSSDIVVIGRITSPSLVTLARTAKHMGCYLVADFGNAAKLSPDHIKLAEIADQLVVGTAETAAILLKETNIAALIIPDCDEKSAEATAHLWMEGFKNLKLKPPACANTNVPVA